MLFPFGERGVGVCVALTHAADLQEQRLSESPLGNLLGNPLRNLLGNPLGNLLSNLLGNRQAR